MSGLLKTAETTNITATVTTSLDQSLSLYRKTTTPDLYGSTSETWPGTPTATIACTVGQPSATMLQSFAAIIGSQRALTLRALSTTDIREGDRVVYDSLNWMVQKELEQSSYSVTRRYLMTVVS